MKLITGVNYVPATFHWNLNDTKADIMCLHDNGSEK